MSRRLTHLSFLVLALLLAPARMPARAQSNVDASLPPAWTAATSGAAAGRLQDEPDPSETPIYAENHLLVRFAPGTPDEVKRALHEEYGAQVIREIPALNIQVLLLPEDSVAMVSAYQAEEEVRYAEPDYLFTIQGWPSEQQPDLSAATTNGLDEIPNDPLYSQQWHHQTINSAGAWDISHGTGVTIAIIDTGADCNHPDLRDKCVRGYDHVNNDADPRDDQGHGTHVSGIAAAMTNNALGIAGTGWDAKIMPVKALNSRGSGNLSWIAAAVTWAVDNGADVINMSLGGRYTSRSLQDAIAYAIDHGVPVIAAAGNDNTSNPSYPAAYPGVIGIAATSQSDTKASFSNYGDYIDVAAPGVAILSSVMGGSYQAWNGTSMASPVVAGVAALLVAQGPCRSPAQIEQILEATSVDLGTRGWDRVFGAGRIDAAAALRYDLNPCGGSSPSPTPPSSGGPPASPTPRPSPTPLPTSPPVTGGASERVEVLINRERGALGLPPLGVLESLRRAAGKHSLDMAVMRQCTHAGSTGSDPASRMRAEGIRLPYGEIVACGQVSPEAAVEAWMNSPGHRAIILCSSCVTIGAGYQASGDGYRHYWTVNFANDPVSGPAPTSPPPPTATDVPPPTATNRPVAPTSPPPTSFPGSTDVELKPILGRAGWVVSTEPYANHFDSADMFTGVWNERAYHGAMQFDLSAIPADAHINFARLQMYGRSSGSLTRAGTWTVNMMDPDVDRGFEGHGYARIHGAGIESPLLPLLSADDIDEGRENLFNFTNPQLEGIRTRVASTALISFRMDGPTSGDFANLASWDTGQSDKATYPPPVLFINYSIGKPVPYPTATATPILPATPVPPDPGPTDPPATIPPTGTPPPAPATPLPSATVPPTPRPEDTQKVVELVPQPEDVGWVRSNDPKSYLGTRNTFTGYYMQQEYHGLVQFDLSQLPKNRVITHARLTLTGQSVQRLSSVGNGRWEAAILTSDVDAGWRYHGFKRIDDTRAVSRLEPALLQADLDVGRENLFVLGPDELRELSWRSLTTGKISFRLDGPRGGTSNVFDWDAGYGGNPPKLTVVMGPPTSDNPLPPAPPSDPERIERLLRAVNDARAQNGLRSLELSDRLTNAAEQHTWDMTAHRFFDHVGSDGSTPDQRVARSGFDALQVDQLIAGQNGEPETVVQTWMRSGEHREKLLDPLLTHFGAYYRYAPGTYFGHYWTLVMAQAR
ncbi:MAG: S8 family serine peptidase [Caldilineae bacterium]|nr:S8 family serine peptidase [Chloroflexota bacterium]MCB9176429.1 S8 family serine peptidase [Caldilineae bacterium]